MPSQPALPTLRNSKSEEVFADEKTQSKAVDEVKYIEIIGLFGY